MQKEENAMTVNMSLLLQNVHASFSNQQYQHGTFLLEYAIHLTENTTYPLLPSSPDVAIGLHQGRVRTGNEDCVLALTGTIPETQEIFGLFVVCDGMGGHTHGQEAAHRAVRTLLEYLFPMIGSAMAPFNGEHMLAEAIQHANHAIYLQNQSSDQSLVPGRESITPSLGRSMGTTITAVLLLGETAYVANVGDSRTYLYDQRLSKITHDHSLVARYLADGILEEEDIYSHPQRNLITRALGTFPSVEVDTFVISLQKHAVLLLCSDGLWEMTRDHKIEAVLASPWADAPTMAHRLVQIANDGGGDDNIGCIVIQLQRRGDISRMETMALDPTMVLSPSGFFLPKTPSPAL